MNDPLLASIVLFAGNFAPRGWALCQGQTLPISEYSALFTLLGTTYGGDGQDTFALPDFRGRVAIHGGSGPGLPTYTLGEQGGAATTTLTAANLPTHAHALNGVSEAGNVPSPAGALLASTGSFDPEYRATGTVVAMNPAAVGATGGNQPFSNVSPYLGLNYIIALAGIYPSRN